MALPPGQNYEHIYHDSFEKAKRDLGVAGRSFDYFWHDIAQNLDDDPFNVYVREVPNTGGFCVYPTKPEHPDFISCVVYFSVESVPEKRINYYGLEGLPEDWKYVPLHF